MEILSLLDHHRNTDIDSHFRVVVIGVQRAKQLLQGAPQISEKPFAKETSRAIYEVLQGDINFVVGTEARLFREANAQTQEQPPEPEAAAEDSQPKTETSATPTGDHKK